VSRPSPEALLREAVRSDRSRLRVFLGAAPGVGKTWAMLEAARERRREGADVVVAVVETHGRAETEALLAGLEVVPRREVEYRGRSVTEMDLDAVLARHPQIALVDELAHTNAPGSRHPKRYSDVEELLDAGIEVYTTVNIQHLESLNDVVTQITGIRVRETVPDRVLERADEIRLVDLPPDDLIKRLRQGKVYVPSQAERAVQNYFNPGNLTALRELALRHAAERVDDDVQSYMRAHAVTGPWAVAERIMVGVGGGPLDERLVRAARRMAARRRAEWLAVFVEPAGAGAPTEAARAHVAATLRLAEQLGAEAVTIPGRDVAAELIRYARERNVSEIVLGKPLHPWWRGVWRRSPVDAVIRGSGDVDVRVITGREGEPAAVRRPRVAPRAAASAGRYGAALVLVGASGAVAKALQQWVGLDDPSTVFLTGVLCAAVAWGLGPSVLAALVSVVVYDLFFIEPLFTLTVTNPLDVVSLAAFLIAAVVTSQLAARARDQAEAARRREARTAALYAFGRLIAGAAGLDDLLPVVVGHVAREFAAEAALLLPAGDRLRLAASAPAGRDLSGAETAAATWVWRHDEPAGPGTDTLPGGEWVFVPLETARGVAGVLGLRPGGAQALSLAQRHLLEAIARQTAVALERTRIDAVLEEKAKTEQVIEASEDGLVVLDADGGVVHVNEVACAILGVERRELVGRRFDELAVTHPHYLRLRGAVRDFLAHPEREGERIEVTLFLRGRDHYYVLRPTPFRTRGDTRPGLILSLQDITYLRDQEARREHLVATLSHELRTPLTSLRMAVELLQRRAGSLPGDSRELVDTAHEDVVRLQEVSQQFLDLARERAMAIAVERRPLDLRAVVDRAVRLFALQARDKGIALEAVPGELPSVVGDETKLTWALSNLLANAVRYTPRGGRVRIEARATEEGVLLAVEDTGPGIPPAQQERIFERFTQSGDAGEVGSAGLGLAIVRDIVQAHGGRIRVDSAPGHGTRFTLELPRE
jgi:two-component system sensor histidine kinase KdpD